MPEEEKLRGMEEPIYAVPGFKASAVAAGIKKTRGLDLALIYSEKVANVAAVFTKNKVKAAPVVLSREHTRDGRARAIVANSGNANACTGKAGLATARKTAELVAGELGILPEEVLVASTGVIGAPLDMDLISRAVPDLVKGLSWEGVHRAAEAIMTTDTFPKISRFQGRAGGKDYGILGIAKGAGMIMPDMATMLGFVMTDLRVEADELRDALISSVDSTFNRISVDGDTSTNDMLVLMANGAAGNRELRGEDRKEFRSGLTRVLQDLAGMIVRDGEGATKVVNIEIRGAHSPSDAFEAARTVANSSLVKTAFYGADPNWGRIMAALGRAGITMAEESVDIWIDEVQIVAGGTGVGPESERKAAEKMAGDLFSVTIDLHQGACRDRVITCDLTHEYVSINAEYRT